MTARLAIVTPSDAASVVGIESQPSPVSRGPGRRPLAGRAAPEDRPAGAFVPRASERGAAGMSSAKNGKFGQNGGKFSAFAHPDGAAVAAFLRRVYPVKTAAAVEAAKGIPADTFRKWEQGSAPSFASTLKLIARHGPEFLCAVMREGAPDWVSAAARAKRHAELEAEIDARRRELAEIENLITAR